MKRRPVSPQELDEHLNRRDMIVFDYLVDQENTIFVHALSDVITDVVEKEGRLYAVGQEVQHPVSKFSYSPWYEADKMFLAKPLPPRSEKQGRETKKGK